MKGASSETEIDEFSHQKVGHFKNLSVGQKRQK
jgi:hypothetical protein